MLGVWLQPLVTIISRARTCKREPEKFRLSWPSHVVFKDVEMDAQASPQASQFYMCSLKLLLTLGAEYGQPCGLGEQVGI